MASQHKPRDGIEILSSCHFPLLPLHCFLSFIHSNWPYALTSEDRASKRETHISEKVVGSLMLADSICAIVQYGSSSYMFHELGIAAIPLTTFEETDVKKLKTQCYQKQWCMSSSQSIYNNASFL